MSGKSGSLNRPCATSTRSPAPPPPRHAAVEPEPDHVLEHGGNFLVTPVPVRLPRVEQVQVPLARATVSLRHARPCGPAELRGPVVRRQLAAGAVPVAEDEPVSLLAAGRRRQRGTE